MELRLLGMIFSGLLIFAGCSEEERSDAYGQFEGVETIISADMQGKLQQFSAREGEMLEVGQQVGWVDTTRLALQRDELDANLEATQARIYSIDAEIDVLKEQLRTAQNELNRTRSLYDDNAATQRQLDESEGRVNTLQKQIEALQIQKQSVRAEIKSVRARFAQLEDQIADAIITNPLSGTVLETFVELHERVQPGQPLYQIVNLDTLELRVYVSGAQLPSIRLGQTVDVSVDKNREENQQFKGKISWISSKAEFTPSMIQTKEERVNQVYAVKVRVPNSEGILKIGMPGEMNIKPNN